MGERERILELVKDGVLSVDEALNLLESLADKETKETENTEFTTKQPVEEPVTEEVLEDVNTLEEEEVADTVAEEAERKHVEDELESLANELNEYSVEIDTLNNQITDLKVEVSDVEETLKESKSILNEEYYEEKKDLENDIVNFQKQIELISMIDEIDSYEELKSLNKELTHAMENLRDLENEAATDEEIQALETEAAELRTEIEKQTQIKNEQLKELHALKMKHWMTKAKQVSENMDIPEGWQKSANKSFNKASDIFEETSKTIGDVFRQTLQSTKETLDKIDWKDMDINLSIPKGESTTFEHEWLFENTTATILDFKNANGDIQFKPSMNDNIKINANIVIRGSIDEASPLAAFEASSIIKVDEDKFTFHVPNKNMTADMIIYLPQREYDYFRSNSFNGDVTFQDIVARDIYVKATNGDIHLHTIKATMVEIKGTNGDITLKGADVRDLLINTVNGDIRVVGKAQSSDVNTTNGTIRLTLEGSDLIRVAGSSVNGDVKISLPGEVGLEIEARSIFGKIKSRLTNTDTIDKNEGKARKQHFRRIGTGDICRVIAQTTTGNVLLKDTEI